VADAMRSGYYKRLDDEDRIKYLEKVDRDAKAPMRDKLIGEMRKWEVDNAATVR
jgi:hypothetical protein